jgi:hypothetical protein
MTRPRPFSTCRTRYAPSWKCCMQHERQGERPFAQGQMRTKLFWGILQALGVMRELRAANFSAHPALSHILNIHIQENAVTKSEMIAMEKRLKNHGRSQGVEGSYRSGRLWKVEETVGGGKGCSRSSLRRGRRLTPGGSFAGRVSRVSGRN